jgi:hypothetical protein
MEDQVPNPAEDLKHAHALLALMSPEELLKATYALEEIIDDSPRFHAKLDEAANGPMSSMEEVLGNFGLTVEDLQGGSGAQTKHGEAA